MLRTRLISAFVIGSAIVVAGCSSPGGARDNSEGGSSGRIVQMDDLESSAYRSINEILVSRVPSVRWAPDGNGIVIRGPQSIQGSNAPLYVVDGVPSGIVAPSVNLQEVAEIEVLSDRSSLSIYGMRGMHGVVLIRTKRPE